MSLDNGSACESCNLKFFTNVLKVEMHHFCGTSITKRSWYNLDFQTRFSLFHWSNDQEAPHKLMPLAELMQPCWTDHNFEYKYQRFFFIYIYIYHY